MIFTKIQIFVPVIVHEEVDDLVDVVRHFDESDKFLFFRLDRLIQLLNTSSVIIGLEFVFSNLCLTVSENLLSLSLQKSPHLFTFGVVSLSFWDTRNS